MELPHVEGIPEGIPVRLPPPPFMPDNREGLGAGIMYRSASESRLTTGASERLRTGASALTRATTARSQAASRASRTSTRSRASTVSAARKHARKVAAASVFESMAMLSFRDHVGCLLQQPLPSKGHDLSKDYRKETQIAPTLGIHKHPTPPNHILVGESTIMAQNRYGDNEDAACRAQHSSEQWRGFPKHGLTEYNEQSVKQSLIMRK
eukprot:TRINITY_DN21861_c0_g1_i1.p1 TRINITY_DN21861_c0_g1~~TRINITY_DN21861_c0_g1_i1.p1  ORF type:complete len:231 (-),score=29.95 TRINITY_DN21861_c0_g1_i1:13-639(-)